jgi:HEAT repeat protein
MKYQCIPKQICDVVNNTYWAGLKWQYLLRHDSCLDEYWIDSFKTAGIVPQSVLDSLSLIKGLSLDELIQLAINEAMIDSPAIAALQLREDTTSLVRVMDLSTSKSYRMRILGARVLSGAYGKAHESEAVQALLQVLKIERSTRVQTACIGALYQLLAIERAQVVLPFVNSSSDSVRFAVAVALGGIDAPSAIEALRQLVADKDAEIREWAVFGLRLIVLSEGSNRYAELKACFRECLSDPAEKVRQEALAALALYKDSKALNMLEKELHKSEVSALVLEAAAAMANSKLYDLLLTIKSGGCADMDRLNQAIKSCRPHVNKTEL